MRRRIRFIKQSIAALSVIALSMSGDLIGGNPSYQEQGYREIEDCATIPLLNPSLQKRRIGKIRLDNGIEAYIISDPDAKHSAMAVTVNAGSWDDPKEYPGMAHFVEHVLFMGTKKYPGENAYMQYIAEAGGHCNAYTAVDRTLYMFSLNHPGFEGAVDRLAHFFIDPSLCIMSVERELKAVDQEHAKNLESDEWRQWMVLKEISNPHHPHVQFSTGNAQTLSNIPQNVLREWFNQHYHPENIRVVLISPLPKDKLIQLVVSHFSLIEDKRQLSSSVKYEDPSGCPLFSDQQKGALLSIQPIRDIKELAVLWELPSPFHSIEAAGPLHFLSYILSSPHSGGMLDMLKERGWIQEGRATFDRLSSGSVLFSVNFTLTEEGVHQRDEILAHLFRTLNTLTKSTPFERYQEVQRLALLQYQHQSRENAFDTVSALGHKMVDEELATFPEKSLLPGICPPLLFKEFITSLKADRATFLLTADQKLSHIAPNRKEQWMEAEYSLVPYTPALLSAWQSLSFDQLVPLPSNPFISSDLSLLESTSINESPRLIVESPTARIYSLQDPLYRVPEIALTYRLYTPQVNGSANSASSTELFCLALNDHLQPNLYMARSAGIYTSLNARSNYIELTLNGYSEKTALLTEKIFATLKNFPLSERQFMLLKKQLLSTYADVNRELPYIQGKQLLDHLILTATPRPTAKAKALEELRYEDFLQFREVLFREIYLEGLFYGNINDTRARQLAVRCLDALDSAPYGSERIVKKIRLLPPEQGPYVRKESVVSQGEATLLLIEQGEATYSRRAAQLLLSKYIQELFFDRLRTKQQTGYIVKSKDLEIEGELLQLFLVQSNSHHTQELLARFELFLDECQQTFTSLIPEESFCKMQAMICKELQLPPENLESMSRRYAALAFEQNGDFDYYTQLSSAIANLTYTELKQFALETLARTNTRRLAILMEGQSEKRPFVYREITAEEAFAWPQASITRH